MANELDALKAENQLLEVEKKRLGDLLRKSCVDERNLAIAENPLTHACDVALEMQAEIEQLRKENDNYRAIEAEED